MVLLMHHPIIKFKWCIFIYTVIKILYFIANKNPLPSNAEEDFFNQQKNAVIYLHLPHLSEIISAGFSTLSH
jgi:hypothetical protein